LRSDNIALNKYGLLYIKNLDGNIRVEDLLRMLLIRGSIIKNMKIY